MNITYEKLLKLSIEFKNDIYQIANFLNIDHKLIRAYLENYNIKLNVTSYSKHNKSYIEPSRKLLLLPLSISAHTNYLCEGWHTEKTDQLKFYNQDEKLISSFIKCVHKIYQYDKSVIVNIIYNKDCEKSKNKVFYYENYFQDTNLYNIHYSSDPTRLNPIILAKGGGKNFAKLFIENAYEILNEINS